MTSELPASGSHAEHVSANHIVAKIRMREYDDKRRVLTKTWIYLREHEEIRVGRGYSNDENYQCININSTLVSKEQFRIYTVVYDEIGPEKLPPMVYCEDLGSANGTYVNCKLIGMADFSESSPYLLTDKDSISIEPHWSFNFLQDMSGQETGFTDIQMCEIATFRGRFSINTRQLGSGICGKVYLACDLINQKQVACKVVDLEYGPPSADTYDVKPVARTKKERERERLIREIQILSKLNHPNIVSLRKAFRSEHTLYLFLELAPAGDLLSFVNSQGGYLSDLYARVILRQLAEAVAYLHSRNLSHRDIKPDNILVMNVDIGHRIVLTDFGCAKILSNSIDRMTSLVGTWEYVAPEVHGTRTMRGNAYTMAVDMWSFGVVTFCLLTGDALASFDEIKRLNQNDIDYRLLHYTSDGREHWASIGTRAKDFLLKVLVFDPANRMTAKQALSHGWFREPRMISHEMDKLYKRSISNWTPRSDEEICCEILSLPQRSNTKKEVPKIGNRKINKHELAMATSSPYFGLDKHFGDPKATYVERMEKKRLIMDCANSSPSGFVHPAEASALINQRGEVRLVEAGNMFENYSATEIRGREMEELRELMGGKSSSPSKEGDRPNKKRKRQSLEVDHDMPVDEAMDRILAGSTTGKGEFAMQGRQQVVLAPRGSEDSFHQDKVIFESVGGEIFSPLVWPPTLDFGETQLQKEPHQDHQNVTSRPASSGTQPFDSQVTVSQDPDGASTLRRHQTLSEEERIMRDDICGSLPKFTSPTAYAKEIKEREEELAKKKL